MAQVLQSLDAQVLLDHGCLFGGGTAIALRCDEFRESADIDFMVSQLSGYRGLRQTLRGPQGLDFITRPGQRLSLSRELRADQYGLRTFVRVDDVQIKFEIVLEGRIELEPAGPDDRVCGVATLTPLDTLSSKLLAHADRWADDATASRDLIDLAMLAPAKTLLRQAMTKAGLAYGQSIAESLNKAIEALRVRPQRLAECMQSLGITAVPRALLWQRIKALGKA